MSELGFLGKSMRAYT